MDLVRSDGSHLPVNMLATPVLDEQGLWVGHLAICIDITERKRVHEALAARDRIAEETQRPCARRHLPVQDGADGRFSVIYASDGMREIYELEPARCSRMRGKVFERIHPQDAERVRSIRARRTASALARGGAKSTACCCRNGACAGCAARPLRGTAGGGTLWHGYVSDISDLKRVEEELRALSITDSLTGIHNRRYFQDRLKAEMVRLNRTAGALSVIMLDIDHFKRINDQHGHAVGDGVLQELCKRIGQRLRRTDVFCRLGARSSWCCAPTPTASRPMAGAGIVAITAQCADGVGGYRHRQLWRGQLAGG
jgi:PAS domain-containing protein